MDISQIYSHMPPFNISLIARLRAVLQPASTWRNNIIVNFELDIQLWVNHEHASASFYGHSILVDAKSLRLLCSCWCMVVKFESS